MTFYSPVFLFAFLPLTAVLYQLVRRSGLRRAVWILSGLVFYAFGDIRHVPLLLASCALHYGVGRLLLSAKRGRKPALFVCVFVDLAVLFFYKLKGALPFGISVFTFQAISYVADVYRDSENGTKNVWDVFQYLTFFPQLTAGPFARFRALRPFFDKPDISWDNNAITNSVSASEAHGYVNRSDNTWYEASEPVVDAMMTVMQDNSVVWGSESHLPSWKHADIDSGDILYENASGLNLIASDGNGGNCTPGLNVTPEQLGSTREIAIRYDGTVAPILALCDAEWGNWTEISAYDIDEEKGIAYYSSESMSKSWGDLSTAAHLFARAGSDMTIYKVASIAAATLDENPTPNPNPNPDPEILLGDVNYDGAVSIADIVLLQKYLLGDAELTTEAFHNADLNQDNALNGMDLSALRAMIWEKIWAVDFAES